MNTYLFTSPKFIPLTPAQALMPFSYLQFYLTGSTTAVDVYADASLDTPLENPVVADSAGVFPFIYMNPDVTYRVQFYDQDDALVWDVDPYTPPRDYAPGTTLMFTGTAEQLEAAYPLALWQVCDGTNGTYDMRGRVPIGVSSEIDPGEAVGSEMGTVTTTIAGAHNHTGSAGSTTLNATQMPAHAHFCAVDVEDSGSPLVSSTLAMKRGTTAGGDTEYRLRGSSDAITVAPSSSSGGGTGHVHSISTDGDHDHDVTVGLPPARGIWFIMRKYP